MKSDCFRALGKFFTGAVTIQTGHRVIDTGAYRWVREPSNMFLQRLQRGNSALRTIKVVHTVIWAFFASCIVAIPIFAWHGEHAYVAIFIGIVSVEILVLVFNRWRCPLTSIAARYTADRRDNFDIYLPEWLARHNKMIFGVLLTAGLLYTVAQWWSWLP